MMGIICYSCPPLIRSYFLLVLSRKKRKKGLGEMGAHLKLVHIIS